MKRAGAILCLSILIILTSFSVCFAQGLELLDSYPRDGSSDSRPESFLVKLYFNEDVSGAQAQEDNKDMFRFTDAKGKELSVIPLYDSKRPKEIWVLVDQTLESDSGYQLFISGDLTNANGDSLGEDKTINLKTRNLNTDNNVNMALMGVMMVGMIVFTTLSAKRQVKKQEEEARAENRARVNPYKVARETGKSVEDIVAKTEKEKEKARAKAQAGKGKGSVQARSNAPAKTYEQVKDTRRVAGPKPISLGGSAYITGRKAEAEKERAKAAARAAAGTTRPKSATGKSRDKKAKSKKK
jgi:hypothetical protein